MKDVPLKQNDIIDLPQLESFRYENLFNVYQNDKDQYFYNILSKVNFPSNMDSAYFDTYVVPNSNMPYTLISYKLYGTTLLWWLICSVNNITNPVFFIQAGTKIKVLKPELVSAIIQSINNDNNQ
jgi:hypothetical protein